MIGCGDRRAERFGVVNNSAEVATAFEAMREVDTCLREVVMTISTVDGVFQ
jgi:hypothetical protein